MRVAAEFGAHVVGMDLSEAVIAARETCHALGVPHVTLDLREEFRKAVVDPFVRGYARGETPNPCIGCNGDFRFGELINRETLARMRPGSYLINTSRGGLVVDQERVAHPRSDEGVGRGIREPVGGRDPDPICPAGDRRGVPGVSGIRQTEEAEKQQEFSHG